MTSSNIVNVRCPYCGVWVAFEPEMKLLNDDQHDHQWYLCFYKCPSPNCRKMIYWLELWSTDIVDDKYDSSGLEIIGAIRIPKEKLQEIHYINARSNIPLMYKSEIPKEIISNYEEALAVLSISPKASALLSRRCLESIISFLTGGEVKNLFNSIEEIKSTISASSAENIDYLRRIGKYAAHIKKGHNPREILDVEPEEADWALKVIESLLDELFIKDLGEQSMREAIDKKLTSKKEKD